VLCFFSCQHHQEQAQKQSEAFKPAKTIEAKPPRIVLFDTCKKPLTVTIPDKPSTYQMTTGGGEVTVPLLPNEVKSAGFLALIQNYGATQGLLCDKIKCCYADHLGNLWFGTDDR